jgi:hypothetical protein
MFALIPVVVAGMFAHVAVPAFAGEQGMIASGGLTLDGTDATKTKLTPSPVRASNVSAPTKATNTTSHRMN